MTGPEHYAAAERLLDDLGDDHAATQECIARAQVHATLALAAASIQSALLGLRLTGADWTRDDWTAVTARRDQR
jgi:hypothetical protein